MDVKEYLYKGWDFATKIAGVSYGANEAATYVAEVDMAIKNMEAGMRSLKSNQSDAVLGGFVAEEWHTDTFNIDAIAGGSVNRAQRLGVTGYGSVDVTTNFGKDYSGKYMSTAEMSATKQALLNRESGTPLYEGQERLIPSDQLEAAKEYAHRQSLRNTEIRPDTSKAYSDTENHLTDRITDSEGHESRALSKAEDLKIAKEIKNDEFSASKHGIDINSVINSRYLIEQALQAGLSAATLTMAFKAAPEIVKIINYLIKNGEIDLQQVKKSGIEVISASSEAFITGSIAGTLKILCEKGVLGEAFKGINPCVMGTVVSIIFQTVKSSILVAAGKMTPREMGDRLITCTVVGIGTFAGFELFKVVGGTAAQSLIHIPVIGYAIGSLIGCMCAVVYQVGKNHFISFCANTGFTCFGLVEQDYQIPAEILSDIGLDLAELDFAEIDRAEINMTDVGSYNHLDVAEIESVEIKMIRRGIIGVNKIGYIV